MALNILQNPSFEAPVVGPSVQEFFQGSVIGAGWVVGASTSSSVIVDKNYTGGGVTWPGPTDGSQFLYMANSALSSTIHQDVGLDPGSYKLTLDLANFLGGGFGAGAKVNGSVGLTTGGSIATQTFTRPVGGGFASFEWSFSITSSDVYRISLESPTGYGSNLDNVSLTAVPEPAQSTMLAAAGCATAAWARSRRRFPRACREPHV